MGNLLLNQNRLHQSLQIISCKSCNFTAASFYLYVPLLTHYISKTPKAGLICVTEFIIITQILTEFSHSPLLQGCDRKTHSSRVKTWFLV